MSAQEYIGPILYIIHAPLPEKILEYAKENTMPMQMTANKAKILTALNSAGIRGIPVVYAGSTNKEWIKGTIAGIKHMPRIIWVRDFEADKATLLQRRLAREKVVPTKIACMGTLRELCVSCATKAIKRAFPKADVHLIEGNYSMLRKTNREMRQGIRKDLEAFGIKRVKKLSFKHLVK